MAELSVRFRTSLRRHYPHQVQGVVQSDLSAIAAPPHFLVAQNKTDTSEVNDEQIAGRLLRTIYKPGMRL
jgi:hypothetical protein